MRDWAVARWSSTWTASPKVSFMFGLQVTFKVSYGGERLEDYIKTCSIIRMVGVNNSENEYFLI